VIRVALGGQVYAFDPPQRPDPPGLVWREVEGWACDCTGPGAGHPAVDCAGRYRITARVPTYPEHDRERLARERDARTRAEGTHSGVIVGARVLRPDDPGVRLPPKAVTLGRTAHKAGRAPRLTYAKGWGRRKTGTGEGAFEPWPVETVALRIPGVGWACWDRFAAHDGRALSAPSPTAWSAAGAMALWERRWYRVTHTQFGSLVKGVNE